MNWDQIQGQWLSLKGKFREQWGKLTDDDIDRVSGKRDQLLGLIQSRYGYDKERAEEEIDRFTRDLTH